MNFPKEINVDPKDKLVIHQKPDDARFKLQKTKENEGASQTPLSDMNSNSVNAIGNKKMGKKGKLLNIGSNALNLDSTTPQKTATPAQIGEKGFFLFGMDDSSDQQVAAPRGLHKDEEQINI